MYQKPGVIIFPMVDEIRRSTRLGWESSTRILSRKLLLSDIEIYCQLLRFKAE
jgi:hypothetical protein